jgi:predicted XRE-type DNA-binding protein
MTAKVRRSSGNVFRDLGFPAGEAESLRLRADLMVQIRRLIEGRKLTQAAAAKMLGVTQPRVSDMVRGKIDLFSLDTLVDMLARAGIRVALTIHRRPSKPRRRAAA